MSGIKAHMLILGGTGYLGRNLAEVAVKNGYRVSIFGRRELSSPDFSKAEISFQGETDGLFVVDAPKNVDVIVNAMTNYGRDGEPESEIFYANHVIPRAIFDHYFKNRSSGPSLFLNVDTVLNAKVSVYAKSKAAFRKDLIAAAGGSAPFVGLRLDQFYGPGDADSKFVTMLIRKFLNKSESIALSSGLQLRRFTICDDVIETILDVAARALNGSLHFVADTAELLPHLGVESSIKDLVLKVQTLSDGGSTRLDFGAIADRVLETDPRKVPTGFEFLEKRVFTGLDEGIARTISTEKQLKEKKR